MAVGERSAAACEVRSAAANGWNAAAPDRSATTGERCVAAGERSAATAAPGFPVGESSAMVTLGQVLSPERVRTDVPAASRKRTLQALGEILADAEPSLSAQAVFDGLVARERLGSTGLGDGCALPHARVRGLGRPIAALLRLRSGVDFDSPDHVPVDLVFGLLVPEESTDEHLEILAATARVLSEERVRSSIRSTDEPARIYATFISNGDGM